MRKSDKAVAASLDKVHFNESWEDYPFLRWVTDNGRSIIWGFCLLALAILALVRYTSGSHSQAETDYINASVEYQVFASSLKEDEDPAIRQEAMGKLQAILDRRPDLHAKYDGLIAQILLIRRDEDLANDYASRALDRTQRDQLKYHQNYAWNSLAISKGKFQEALDNAVALKRELESELKNASSLLYAYNLLRIAVLEEVLKNPEGEREAWEAVSAFAAEHPATFQQLATKFQDGKASLLDYIASKKK